MKKKLFCFIFICLCFFEIFSENSIKTTNSQSFAELSYAIDFMSEIKFENGKMIISHSEVESKNFISDYNVEQNSKVTFINLEETGEKILVLKNEDLIFLYKDNNEEPWIYATNLGRASEGIYFPSPQSFSASSELKEGKVTYSVGNLGIFMLNKPWVEGILGNGEGEYIELQANISSFYLFNGYISYTKPHLYEENSRVKKIQISFLDNPKLSDLTVELEDTPNPQKVSLDVMYNGKIRIDILEVYPGTKYEDTCITNILCNVF